MTCTEDGVSVIMYPIFRKSLMSEAFVGPASSRKDFVRPALTRSFSFVPFAGLGHAHNLRWFQHCWTRLGLRPYPSSDLLRHGLPRVPRVPRSGPLVLDNEPPAGSGRGGLRE